MIKKIISLSVFMLCMIPFAVQAQSYDDMLVTDTVSGLRHYKTGDNWFFTLHAGIDHSLGENVRPRDSKQVIGGGAGFSVGKYFSPSVGARLQFAFFRQRGRANQEAIDAYGDVYGSGVYKFNNFNVYLDALLNVSNIFSRFKESRRFNIVGIVGVGANATGGFEDKVNNWNRAVQTQLPEFAPYKVYTDSKAYFALRTGFLFNYYISNKWDLGLEITMNATDDGYNGVRYDDKYDGYVNALVGLTYHFKDQYGDHRFKYRKLTDINEINELNRKVNTARADLNDIRPETRVEATQVRILDMTVSFAIDKYNITDVQRRNVEAVANYIKSHNDINVVVTGYADVQTAYPAYNLKLSERRAKAVYNMLVNDYGVDPSRLRIDYKGDVVQPYQRKNEWNRVVVFILEPRNK